MTTAWKTPRLPSAPSPGHKRNSPLPSRRCITTPPTVDTVVGRERAGGRAGGGERSTLLPSLRSGRATHNNGGAKAPHTSHAHQARRPASLPGLLVPYLAPGHLAFPSPPATSPHPSPAQVLQKLNASHATLPISSRGKRVPLAVPIFFRTAPDRLPTGDPSARTRGPTAAAHPARRAAALETALPDHLCRRRRPQMKVRPWPFTRSTTVSSDSRRAPAPPRPSGTIHYDSDKNKSEK